MPKVFFQIIVVLSALAGLTSVTYAQNDVQFRLNKNLISQEGEIYVSFVPQVAELTNFVVRPELENGFIYIFDDRVKKWVSGTDLWSSMPVYQSVMLIKISSTGMEKSSLKFVFKNLADGREYLSETKAIWGKRIYKKYIEQLNNSIMTIATAQSIQVGKDLNLKTNLDSATQVNAISNPDASYLPEVNAENNSGLVTMNGTLELFSKIKQVFLLIGLVLTLVFLRTFKSSLIRKGSD